MTGRRTMRVAALIGAALAVSAAQALPRTWSGGELGAWTVAGNWSPSGVPTTSDDVVVGPGATVTNASDSFKTLVVQEGAAVKLATDLTSGRMVSVAGTLGRDITGVLRLNGATVNLSGHLGSTINFLDTSGGAINFTNGAAFDLPSMSFELKGNTTYSFKLSASGFKTVAAGFLYSGNNGSFSAAWSNVTYNVDISDYDLRGGLRIVLMDFSGNAAVFNSGFSAAKVNLITGSSGLTANLSFDASTSQLVLTFPYPLTWSGGGDGANWMDRLNWTPTNLPTASDDVLIKAGASVTNGQSSFKTLVVQAGATNKLSAATGGSGFLSSSTLSVAGTLDVHAGGSGVVRMGGATISLSGHLGAGISWLDMYNGSISFTNGAAFDNPGLAFEHKGNNTFRFTLATNGFETLVAGKLWSGSYGGYAAWSNATYNIDIAGYTGRRPADVVLVDYSSHDAIFTNTFNPTVTVSGLSGGKLRFDTATSRLILRVSGPKGTLVSIR